MYKRVSKNPEYHAGLFNNQSLKMGFFAYHYTCIVMASPELSEDDAVKKNKAISSFDMFYGFTG